MLKYSGLILALFISSCSTGGGLKNPNGFALPQDIPQELQNRFEVTDSGQPTPSPSPSPSPSVAASSSHKKAKPKVVKKSKKVEKVFVYPNRRIEKDPIWENEKVTFDVTFFGASAGEFTMQVLPFKVINGRKVYHLHAEAHSSAVFNLFYKLNDSLESFFDYEGLFSHRFHLVLNQSKQTRDALELFDSEKMQTYYWNRKNHVTKGYTEDKDFHPLDIPFSQDSFSSIFYIRTLPLEVGHVYSVPVVSEGRNWQAIVTVLRKEMLDTPLGKIRTIVVSPKTKFQGVMKQNEKNSFIWLSDDDRRFVMRVEAEVKIGTVVAKAIKVEKGTPP